jgi:hypothetical protein
MNCDQMGPGNYTRKGFPPKFKLNLYSGIYIIKKEHDPDDKHAFNLTVRNVRSIQVTNI